MADITQEKMRLLVKVGTLYYVDGLNQQEIAERLGISRPQISRMLAYAKAEGIVQITIKNPFSEEQTYERAIAETFGIHDVIVVHVPGADQQLIDLQLARAGAALLENVFKDRDIVGVMAGQTIASIGNEINYFTRKNMQFVPLVGGWGSAGAYWHANSNTRVLAEKLKSKYWLLNAPAIVASSQARDILVEENEIQTVLKLARQANVALVGIGQVSEQATIVRSGYFDKKDIDEVLSLGAVANICTSFINERGESIPYHADSRMIGLNADELRKAPNVIAIASGEEKVAAITAALRGQWVDVLVIDMKTAKSVLEWHRLHPVQ
ncbi:sugar-binding transcriptional regulator [Paenibacillus eucommiae]|uniref:DNA-binding transcriptional regulator LsrR (DeoR family) n=1 Tax=Paenibacillus eucommiae TaxID=1355755 RepID=A0ABS4J2X2_9BACL|nr:sugar-binding transcriptional regulator [Paenibacillus eucommiae]MBP1994194.1 DNA-binding transcriptional regulator LsrR (DeoR family) [Paenibacillus eucommiae]